MLHPGGLRVAASAAARGSWARCTAAASPGRWGTTGHPAPHLPPLAGHAAVRSLPAATWHLGQAGAPAARTFATDAKKPAHDPSKFAGFGVPLGTAVGGKARTAPPKPIAKDPPKRQVPESSSPVVKGGSTIVPATWGLDTSASETEAQRMHRELREGLIKGFDMERLGVGGMDAQLAQIFRRVFASRAAPASVVRALKVRHVKGMLLHGPPGTGKTLIARQLGVLLNAKPPKIVNGPEIMQNIVNQLLTKLDGVNKLNNILVVGITNRKDMLDDALLRPGRLEVQVEIALPDAAGRRQILSIHSSTMREAGALAPDVDLESLAHSTTNFSGAELEGLVTAAASFALDRSVKRARENLEMAAGAGAKDVADVAGEGGGEGAGAERGVEWPTEAVTMEDFEQALGELTPAFGAPIKALKALAPHGLFHHSPAFEQLLATCRLQYRQVRDGSSTPVLSALLYGGPGTGKSALAATLGLECGYPLVRLVTADALVGRSSHDVSAALVAAFNEAYASSASMIIVDDLERIVGYSRAGRVFDNGVLQTLLVLLRRRPPNGRKLMVICTSSMPDAMEYLEIDTAITTRHQVPPMSRPAAEALLGHMGVLPGPEERVAAVAQLPAEIAVKHVIMLCKMAGQRSGIADIAEGMSAVTLEAWASAREDMGAVWRPRRVPRRGVRRIHLPRRRPRL